MRAHAWKCITAEKCDDRSASKCFQVALDLTNWIVVSGYLSNNMIVWGRVDRGDANWSHGLLMLLITLRHSTVSWLASLIPKIK